MSDDKPIEAEIEQMQGVSDWLENATGVKPQVGIERYEDRKLVSQVRLINNAN